MKDWKDDWTVGIGRYEDGDAMVLPVPGVGGGHWVVAGSTHSGKTDTMRLVMARIAVKYGAQVAFAIADPHMVGFRKFLPRASMIGYGRGDSSLRVLSLVEAEHLRRLQFMFRHDIEEWSPEVADLLGPYVILAVDEMSAITLAPPPPKVRGEAPEPSAEGRLITLAQEARKTGIGLILAAQSPKVKVIHGLILEQCPIRWCGRTRRREQTEAVLETSDYPCHLSDHPKGCPIGMPGVAYVDDGLRIRRGRSDGIKPELFARIARERAADRFDGFGWPHEIQSGMPTGAEREEVSL